MSIIYGTLERLETDDPALMHNSEQASSVGKAVEPRSLPIKALVTALLLAMTGANLLLWYWSNEVGAPQYPTPAAVSTQMVVPEISDREPASASVGETPTKLLEQIEPNSGVATEWEAAPMNTTTIDEVVKADVQPITEAPQVPSPDSVEKPAALAGESIDPVSSPASKPEAMSAEPADRITVPSSDTGQTARVDVLIERARVALSRGQYQQALVSLELLQPIPVNRPDFWLIKGSALLGTGQLDLAELAFTSAQALAPDNVQIAVQQAILKQEKGDHAGALHILEAAAKRHPNVPEIFLNQGHSLYALGAEREAKRSFRAFLRLTEGRSLYMHQRKAIKEWLTPESSVQG
jgi:hypothetical protein